MTSTLAMTEWSDQRSQLAPFRLTPLLRTLMGIGVVRSALALLFAMALVQPLQSSAQEFFGLGGVEGRIGFSSPDDASARMSAAVDADLGWFGIAPLRAVVGMNFFSANVSNRTFGGERRVSGSFTGIGARAGLRLDLLGGADFSPSVGASLTAHRVTVDGPTPEDRGLLDREFGGFLVGLAISAGGSYVLDEEGRFRAVLEIRRAMMPNTPHWAGEAGVRIMLRGRDAYRRDPVPASAADVRL